MKMGKKHSPMKQSSYKSSTHVIKGAGSTLAVQAYFGTVKGRGMKKKEQNNGVKIMKRSVRARPGERDSEVTMEAEEEGNKEGEKRD